MLQARYMTGSIQPTIGNLSREHALPQKKQDSAGTLKGLCVLFLSGGCQSYIWSSAQGKLPSTSPDSMNLQCDNSQQLTRNPSSPTLPHSPSPVATDLARLVFYTLKRRPPSCRISSTMARVAISPLMARMVQPEPFQPWLSILPSYIAPDVLARHTCRFMCVCALYMHYDMAWYGMR